MHHFLSVTLDTALFNVCQTLPT